MHLDASNSGVDETSKNRGVIRGHITSDGIIDDDFETELGGHETAVRRIKQFLN